MTGSRVWRTWDAIRRVERGRARRDGPEDGARAPPVSAGRLRRRTVGPRVGRASAQVHERRPARASPSHPVPFDPRLSVDPTSGGARRVGG